MLPHTGHTLAPPRQPSTRNSTATAQECTQDHHKRACTHVLWVVQPHLRARQGETFLFQTGESMKLYELPAGTRVVYFGQRVNAPNDPSEVHSQSIHSIHTSTDTHHHSGGRACKLRLTTPSTRPPCAKSCACSSKPRPTPRHVVCRTVQSQPTRPAGGDGL